MSLKQCVLSGGLSFAVFAVNSSAVAGFTADGNVYLRSHEIQREQSGDNLLSPFANVDRDHEIQGHLNTHWEITPYRMLDTQWAVAHRRTDLGDPHKGSRLSRASLRYQHGVAPLPYVLEAGDIYVQHSSRSLRRNLKGAQIEFQPLGEMAQSIQISAGLDNSEWDNAGDGNRFLATSWLAETDGYGAFTVGHIFSEDFDHDDEQRSSSAAWSHSWQLHSHQLQWELEWLHHGNDQSSGSGYFGDLQARLWSGASRVHLAYEEYDEDFRPRGGVVAGGQRRWQFNLQQRLPVGLLGLEASRINFYQIAGSDHNIGFSYTVRPFDALSINARASEREFETPFGTTTTDSVNIGGSLQVSSHHALQISGSEVRSEFDDGSISRSERRDLSLGFRSSGELWHGQWSLAPRVSWRELETQSSRSEELAPGLTLGYRHQRHDLQLNYGASLRDSDIVGRADTRFRHRRLNLRYGYQQTQTLWSLEVGRSVSKGSEVPELEEDSILLSVDHRFRYNKNAEKTTQALNHAYSPVDPILALAKLIGNGQMAVAQAVVNSTNPSEQLHLGDRSEYRGQFLPGEFESQTLVLHSRNGFLTDVEWSIDLRGKSAADIQGLFERNRGRLYQKLGQPVQLAESSHEWRYPAQVLRFGLPQSVSGETQLKLIIRQQFLTPLDNDWG